MINLNKEKYNLEDVIIADTGVWENIGTTLNISLTEIAEMKVSDNAIFVNPTFLTQKNLSPKGIFVIMPFAEEFTPVYADHIKKVAERLDLEIKRGDDFYKAQSIMQDVWDGIYNSRLLIADCTGKNPNIFYEIGLAHAIGKPVILITQEISDIPFDLAHMRIIEYKYTPPGMTEFETTLKKFVVEHYK